YRTYGSVIPPFRPRLARDRDGDAGHRSNRAHRSSSRAGALMDTRRAPARIRASSPSRRAAGSLCRGACGSGVPSRGTVFPAQSRLRVAMRFFTFEVVIERRAGEDEYAAYSPTLAGCFARGATIEEARRNVHDAIRQRLEALPARGEPVVEADDLRYVEQLTIGIPS